MKQISKTAQEFYLKDTNNSGKICRVERYMTKVENHLREVNVISICRREDTTLIPEYVFRYFQSAKRIDMIRLRATKRWPSLENLTNTDLISETRSRGLYSLDKVPDDVIFVEALSRGLVTALPPTDPVPAPDPVDNIGVTDTNMVDAGNSEVTPRKGFFARFRLRRRKSE